MIEGLTEDLARRIEKAAEAPRAAGAREVYVFGSVAQGKIRGNSDVALKFIF